MFKEISSELSELNAKWPHRILRFRVALVAVLICLTPLLCSATTYYVHSGAGNDANHGTNAQSPWRTLERASAAALREGDSLLLASGQKFSGQLSFSRLAGTAARPITISSYAADGSISNARPVIDARGWPAGVLLQNSAHVAINNLHVTANAGGLDRSVPKNTSMRCGVLIEADKPGDYAGISISNVVVKDVFFEEMGFIRGEEEVRSANGTQKYGWGIRLLVTSPSTTMQDVLITDCQIENVCHTGLKLNAPSNGLQNVLVQRVTITNTGGPGVQMSGVSGGRFSHLDVNRSGSTDDSRKWGRGSGLWTWGSSDVLIEKSRFQNANGPGDSAGVHIDYHCRNVIVQHNFSANNAGGFCEILGNNYNCAYRYNISVNDGHRVKGVGGAFQEGKVFWLSGYTGNKSPRQGPFNTYFYNNTIYTGDEMVANISVAPTTQGVLIANNIFYFKGRSRVVVGDQMRPDDGHPGSIKNVVFQNNLFLRADNWPTKAVIQDQSPSVGDPEFKNAGGVNLSDYVPRNAGLIAGKSIPIRQLPNDKTGLFRGLKMDQDILGQTIIGLPDIGAIQTEIVLRQANVR